MTDGMGQFLEFLKNPYTLGALGTAAVLGGCYYLWNRGTFGGILGALGLDELCECAAGHPKAIKAPSPPKIIPVVAAAPAPRVSGGKCVNS